MNTICGNGCGTKINQCNTQIMCDSNIWPVQVLSKNGQEFYPLTHTKAIVANDCQTLDNVFEAIDSKINTQILDVNVNLSDDIPVSLNIDDDGVCRLNPVWLASQHKAIRLKSVEKSMNDVIVFMDRAEIVPVLDSKGNYSYNSNREIVAITYWKFVYDGYEYVIDSTCHTSVHPAAEGGSGQAGEVVRQDVNGNKRLQLTSLGKAIIPLVTDTDSGLITASDWLGLKALLAILSSYNPNDHTITINNIIYQLTPKSDKFKWNNNQAWDDNNKWEL